MEDDVDLFCLHYVYKPRINNAINLFTQGWNHHKLRTERNRTPIQLFTEGMLSLHGSGYTAVRDIFDNPDDETQFQEIDDEEYMPELQNSNDVQVPSVRCPVTENELIRLRESVDPLATILEFRST